MTTRVTSTASRRAFGPQLFAVLLVVGLAGAMGITPTRELLAQRSRIAGMSADLRQVQRSNQRLQARVDRLRDPNYVEEQAREQFGLVRPGETAYVVIPKRRHAGKRSHGDLRHARARGNQAAFLERVLRFIGLD